MAELKWVDYKGDNCHGALVYHRKSWSETWKETGKVAAKNPSPNFRVKFQDTDRWNESVQWEKKMKELRKLGVDITQIQIGDDDDQG